MMLYYIPRVIYIYMGIHSQIDSQMETTVVVTDSHEPGWGGLDPKQKLTYTNVNIPLDIVLFGDECNFETAKVIILHKFCQTIAHYWCSVVILMQNK